MPRLRLNLKKKVTHPNSQSDLPFLQMSLLYNKTEPTGFPVTSRMSTSITLRKF